MAVASSQSAGPSQPSSTTSASLSSDVDPPSSGLDSTAITTTIGPAETTPPSLPRKGNTGVITSVSTDESSISKDTAEASSDSASPTDTDTDTDSAVQPFAFQFGTFQPFDGKVNITGSDGSVTDTSLISTTSTSAPGASDGSIHNMAAPVTSISGVDSSETGATQGLSVEGEATSQSTGQQKTSLIQNSGPTTVSGATYTVSSIVSVYQTTLANGAVVTSSTTVVARVPLPAAETNSSDNNDRGEYNPPNPPGPIEITPGPSTGFLQKPAAAAGVFVAVLFVIGALVWMWFLIKHHRRQAAADAKRKRPRYAYGATGMTPGDRGSYFSYHAPQWPQQFQRDEEESNPPVQLRSSYPADTPDVSTFPRPDSGSQTLAAFDISNDLLPPSLLVTRRPSVRDPGPSRITSPPIPIRSSLRSISPAETQDHVSIFLASGDLENGARVQSFTSPSAFYSPPSTSRSALSRSDSFGRQPQLNDEPNTFQPHSYPTRLTTIYDAIEPPSPSTRHSLPKSDDALFRASAFLASSPPSTDPFVTQERLSNPFSDAESPLQKSSELPYVHGVEAAASAAVLERGVSLRRNNTLREKPEQHLTPNPSVLECGSSGSEGASSALYPLLLSRQPSGFGRQRSESLSTAETSVGNISDISSPIERNLFYNPAFASPVHTINPPWPEVQ